MAQNGKYDKYFQFCSNLKGYNFDHFDSIEPFELFHLNFSHGFCLFRIFFFQSNFRLKKLKIYLFLPLSILEITEHCQKIAKMVISTQ